TGRAVLSAVEANGCATSLLYRLPDQHMRREDLSAAGFEPEPLGSAVVDVENPLRTAWTAAVAAAPGAREEAVPAHVLQRASTALVQYVRGWFEASLDRGFVAGAGGGGSVADKKEEFWARLHERVAAEGPGKFAQDRQHLYAIFRKP